MTVIDIHTHLLPKVDDSRMKKHKFSSMMTRYKEAGIVPTVFNGIEGVGLVLLEKKI